MSESLKVLVRTLFLVERKTRAQITEQLHHRLSAASVHEYIREAVRHAEQTGIEIPPTSARTGGVKARTSRKAISAHHRAAGVRLLRHRTSLNLERADYADRYDFANRIWIGEMEDGLHDFTLSQLMYLAEMIGISLEELIQPLTCKSERMS